MQGEKHDEGQIDGRKGRIVGRIIGRKGIVKRVDGKKR